MILCKGRKEKPCDCKYAESCKEKINCTTSGDISTGMFPIYVVGLGKCLRDDKLQPICKCRLCGKEILGAPHEVEYPLTEEMYVLDTLCKIGNGETRPFSWHRCENGDFGLCDFLGYVIRSVTDGIE